MDTPDGKPASKLDYSPFDPPQKNKQEF